MVAKHRELSVTEAKNKLTQLIREVEQGGEVTITRDRRPAAVLLSWEAYRRLKRELAVVRLRKLRDQLTGLGITAQEALEESRRQLEDRAR